MTTSTRPPAMPWLIVGLIGGVSCLVGDHLHVVEGVLFYPRPIFWDQAWWVFPLFFAATLVILRGAPVVYPLERESEPGSMRAAVGDFLALLTAYAFTAFAHTLPDVVLAVLLGFWAARVVRGMPPRHILLCLVVALGGTSWEAFWSSLGMFTYRHPDFLGVPRWLPALYLHAGIAADSGRRILPQAASKTQQPTSTPA